MSQGGGLSLRREGRVMLAEQAIMFSFGKFITVGSQSSAFIVCQCDELSDELSSNFFAALNVEIQFIGVRITTPFKDPIHNNDRTYCILNLNTLGGLQVTREHSQALVLFRNKCREWFFLIMIEEKLISHLNCHVNSDLVQN